MASTAAPAAATPADPTAAVPASTHGEGMQRRRRPREFSHSYAQEGEDLILAEWFQRKRNGFFVDVGAHHPRRFSNTYHFYRFRGWRGINIDAMPGSMRAFRRARPLDINVEAAVSDRPQTLEFFIFNETALNTFDPALAAERDGCNGYRLVRTAAVPTVPLRELLHQHLPAGQPIDFMTVDVEGLDLAVLRSNDWTAHRPAVLLVEDVAVKRWRDIGTSATTRFLAQWNYEPFASTTRTIFYRREGA